MKTSTEVLFLGKQTNAEKILAWQKRAASFIKSEAALFIPEEAKIHVFLNYTEKPIQVRGDTHSSNILTEKTLNGQFQEALKFPNPTYSGKFHLIFIY